MFLRQGFVLPSEVLCLKGPPMQKLRSNEASSLGMIYISDTALCHKPTDFASTWCRVIERIAAGTGMRVGNLDCMSGAAQCNIEQPCSLYLFTPLRLPRQPGVL